MLILLLLLLTVIAGYWYLTDSRRVRAMAQSYLAQLIGEQVTVKSATLSIFEGLRLDGVTIRVNQDAHDKQQSRVFHAQTIYIRYNPQSLFSGRLEATQIIALEPEIFLCENLDTGTWNWKRVPSDQSKPPTPPTRPRIKFPEILLRDVKINYMRIRNGQVQSDRGLMEIEGSIKPERDDRTLAFMVQSRQERDKIGPIVRGTLQLDGQIVSATMENLQFGEDLEVMLPEQVRNWCREHKLKGKLDIDEFFLQPASAAQALNFRIETRLRGVELEILPENLRGREEIARLSAMRRQVDFMRAAGLDAGGLVTRLEKLFDPQPVALSQVDGKVTFTPGGIDIERIDAHVENNAFSIGGRIGDYSVDAPFVLRVQSGMIYLPTEPRFANSVSLLGRELFDALRPEGSGRVWFRLERVTPGGKPQINGALDIEDGRFCLDEFPYPMHKAVGRVTFGWDERTRMDRIDIMSLRAWGLPGSANADVAFDISGFAGPLGPEAEFKFVIQTRGLSSEPALMRALPRVVREALRIFDAPGTGEHPWFRGNFNCLIHRPPGLKQRWSTSLDAELLDARGILTFFPYPVEHMTAGLSITPDETRIRNGRLRNGSAELIVDGVVRHLKGQPVEPRLDIRSKDLPLDRHLLGALPADSRHWLEKLGVTGVLDVEGKIAPDPASKSGAVGFDLNVDLKNGTIWPAPDGTPAVSDLSGRLHITPGRIVMSDLAGKRGAAPVQGSGLVSLQGQSPRLALSVSAQDLQMDAPLYRCLPEGWRKGWDSVRPEGTIDLNFNYSGAIASSPTTAPTTAPATAPAAATAAVEAAPSAPAAPGQATEPPAGFSAILRPRKLSATPQVIPVRLDQVTGEIIIRPDAVVLKEIAAKRKSGGAVAINGSISTDDRAVWDLKLSATETLLDKELRKAVPPAVARFIDGLGIEGRIGIQFDKLAYRPATSDKADDGELDMAGAITLAGNSFNGGIPVTDVHGTLRIAQAQARKGKLGAFGGSIELSQLKLGERPITNLKAELIKPEAHDALRIGKIAGEIAGGEIAGQVDLLFPEKGNSRFGIVMLLRNADVQTLTGPSDKEIKGRLSASLSVEGDWGDPSTRRGRGDVSVTGKEMYRIPLILGLVQITNLSLPISSPFQEAVARYTVEGQKVGFEQIELRASNILMSGNGWMDFGTRKVKMTFMTDNPNAWRIPFLHELIQGARQELFQIHVTGTIQEPKVSGALMNTFSTTVDEVLGANSDKGGRKPKK